MKNIETTDIVLASYLKVKGYKLEQIKKEGNRGIFVFTNVEEDVVDGYHLGKGLCEPVSFNNATRALTTAVRRLNN